MAYWLLNLILGEAPVTSLLSDELFIPQSLPASTPIDVKMSYISLRERNTLSRQLNARLSLIFLDCLVINLEI